MRNRFANTFYELGKSDPNLCIVVADISPAGSIEKFRSEFPRRFINTGVAEQIMIGLAAGMAQRGMRMFAYTIATFALYRAFEFIRCDLAYQNLPVTVVGIGGGVNYSTLGATHHAQEDIGIACAVPNMTVIAPCDPVETEAATRWCAQQNCGGPVYLRLGRAGEPCFDGEPWRFGKLRHLRIGADICLISYGPIMRRVFTIADALQAQGKSVGVVSCHTIKPLDHDGLELLMHLYPHVAVIEEAAPGGSLAMQAEQLAWRTKADCRIDTFTLADEFIHCCGSHDDILDAHGMSVAAICNQLLTK